MKTGKTFKTTFILISGFLLLAMSSAAFAEDLKVGYIDLNRALNEVDEAEKAKTKLEKEFEKKKDALEKKKQELLDFKTELEASVMVLSETERKTKVDEFQSRYLALEEEYLKIKEEFFQRREEETKKIFDKMEPIIADLGKKKGFTLIYEKSQHGILYAEDAIDLTDKVLKQYNKTY